jgi:hypothetical protein
MLHTGHGSRLLGLGGLVFMAICAQVSLADAPRYCNGRFIQENGWDNGALLYPNGSYVRDNGWPNGSFKYPNGQFVRDNGWENGAIKYPNGQLMRDNGWPTGSLKYANGNFIRQNGWVDGAILYPNGKFFRENGWADGRCLYANGMEMNPCRPRVKIRDQILGFGRLSYELVTSGATAGTIENIQYEVVNGTETTFFDLDPIQGKIENIDAWCE